MLRPVLACLFLGALGLLALCSATGGTPPVAARFGLALDGRPIEAARLETLATAHGHRPGFVVVFEQWPENPPASVAAAQPGLAGLAQSLATIAHAGAVPVVTWEPMFYRQADGAEVILTEAAISDGRYNVYLDSCAALFASQPGRVIVRLMHEPNLNRYHWGVTRDNYGPAAPAVYQRLWRHIVGRVRSSLGPASVRVQFAFCVNAESVPGPGNAADAAWNTIAAYYPGAAWADLLGVDGYNWGDTQTPAKHGWQSSWRSFESVLGPAVDELRSLAPGQPMHVFECASAPTGGDKTAWLRAAAATARAWDLAAVCWFEADKEVDWRLTTGVPAEEISQFVAAISPPRS